MQTRHFLHKNSLIDIKTSTNKSWIIFQFTKFMNCLIKFRICHNSTSCIFVYLYTNFLTCKFINYKFSIKNQIYFICITFIIFNNLSGFNFNSFHKFAQFFKFAISFVTIFIMVLFNLLLTRNTIRFFNWRSTTSQSIVTN